MEGTGTQRRQTWGEVQTLVSDQQMAFTKTFDTVCWEHKVKEDY